MGRPAHYSIDVVARCRSLLEQLMPVVSGGLPDGKAFDGPLTTTFLLAMATPMIGLPIERVFKPNQPGDVVADDSPLNEGLKEEVLRVFDDKLLFSQAPFVGNADWRLLREVAPFNIAEWEAGQHLEALSLPDARKTAEHATARFMLKHLRNALAHGGVAYLDANGRLVDKKAEMLAFVSCKSKNGHIVGLHVSRISEQDFMAFLLAWADWIAQSGLSDELSADPLLAA